MNIINHSGEFMSTVVENFVENQEVLSGLNTFFPRQTVRTKAVTLNVIRNGKPIAIDVQRCVDASRREFSKSTQKIFVPPSYKEKFDFTACEAFDRVSAGQDLSQGDAANLLDESTTKLQDLRNAQERAILKQEADILQFGFATFKNHDSIDFRRKAASMVTKTGAATWNQSTADPKADLQVGCNFLRSIGGSTGGVVNAIMGENALSNLIAHPKIIANADIKNINRDQISMPMMEASGLVFHGQMSAGDFIVNLWTYNDEYEETNGVFVRYIATDNVVLLPTDFRAKVVFAAQNGAYRRADGSPYIQVTEGEYLVTDYVDAEKTTWEIELKSAPLAIPITVDKMYTIKTL